MNRTYRSPRPYDSAERQLNYIFVPVTTIRGRKEKYQFMLVKRSISKREAMILAKKWRRSSPKKKNLNPQPFRHMARIKAIGGNRYNLYLGGNYDGATDRRELASQGFRIIR